MAASDQESPRYTGFGGAAVDGAVRGRVMSTFVLIYQGMPALGGLAFGHLAEIIGLRSSFALGAGLCFCVFFWMLPRTAAMAPTLEGTTKLKEPAS